eukprot:s192_g29.t1
MPDHGLGCSTRSCGTDLAQTPWKYKFIAYGDFWTHCIVIAFLPAEFYFDLVRRTRKGKKGGLSPVHPEKLDPLCTKTIAQHSCICLVLASGMAQTHEVLGTFEVSSTETVTITLKHGSIDVIVHGQGPALMRSASSPCLPGWVKPGEGPSKLDLHIRGECRPCLFFTRKADGCRKGDACDHCHFCSAEETRKKLNRAKVLNKKAKFHQQTPGPRWRCTLCW